MNQPGNWSSFKLTRPKANTQKTQTLMQGALTRLGALIRFPSARRDRKASSSEARLPLPPALLAQLQLQDRSSQAAGRGSGLLSWAAPQLCFLKSKGHTFFLQTSLIASSLQVWKGERLDRRYHADTVQKCVFATYATETWSEFIVREWWEQGPPERSTQIKWFC